MLLLTGTGGLFTRLGKLVGLLDDLNDFRGGTSAGQLVKAIDDVLAAIDGDTPTVRATVQPAMLSAITSGQSSLTAVAQAVQTAATNLLIAMANADTPLVQQTATYALALLKSQMLAGGDYVTANTVSATVTPASGNFGNGAIVCGTRDSLGYQLDNLLAETISVTCTGESAGAGTLSFRGQAVQPDPLNWAWPAGSGCNKSLSSISAAGNTGYLQNGGWETWTSNTPGSWTISVGTAGTDFGAAGAGFVGANALKLIGGTGVLTSLTQAVAAVEERTPYALNLWLKADVAPASGVLQIDLYNGSAVIADDAGNACSLAINLSALTTGYVAHSAMWRVADPLPATTTLRVHLTTAVPSGSNVFLDELTLQPAAQLGQYAGDTIWVAACTGSADWALKDTLSIATANNRACQWQQAFDRLFGTRKLGFVLPTTGTTLIDDSLIGD